MKKEFYGKMSNVVIEIENYIEKFMPYSFEIKKMEIKDDLIIFDIVEYGPLYQIESDYQLEYSIKENKLLVDNDF